MFPFRLRMLVSLRSIAPETVKGFTICKLLFSITAPQLQVASKVGRAQVLLGHVS